MALTTLPYPSLDFVPLDILTAEEMNQIVANYTAINNSTIGTNQLANNSITTPKLANKAVTSDKVNWTTFAPFWKTVTASTSTSVKLPAGYRLYRVHMVVRKNSNVTWGNVSCQQATGTTWIYIQGMSAGTWITAERSVAASSDKSIMDGARGATAAGIQTWDITLSRLSANDTAFTATWETSTSGSLTYNTGRSMFTVSSGTAGLTLSSELSAQFFCSVEVLVES